jgi:hypothetical protein
VAVGTEGTGSYHTMMTSSNGHTYTNATTPIDGSSGAVLTGCTYSSALGVWVAVGRDASGNAVVLSSSDGSTWTRRDNGYPGFWKSVAWSPSLGLFCASGVAYTTAVVVTGGWVFGATAGATSASGWVDAVLPMRRHRHPVKPRRVWCPEPAFGHVRGALTCPNTMGAGRGRERRSAVPVR